MRNQESLEIGKANETRKGARGLEMRDLPFGLDATAGPTAYRNVRSPMRRYASSDAKMDNLAILIDELQKPAWRRKRSRKQLLRALDQFVVAERAGQRG